MTVPNLNRENSCFVGGIPKNAKVNQLLGAVKSEGYKVMNQLVLKKGRNGNQWTFIEFENKEFKNSALRTGIKFGRAPNTTLLTIEPIKPKSRRRSRSGGDDEGESNEYESTNKKKTNKKKIVFISGIPAKASVSQFKGALTRQGYSNDKLVTDFNKLKLTNARNGNFKFCELKFKRAELAKKAVRNGISFSQFGEKIKLRVKWADAKRNSSEQDQTSNKKTPNGPDNNINNKNNDFYLTAIVDLSGSMHGERIKAAMNGLKLLCGNLRDNDYFSLIGFNATAKQLLGPCKYHRVKDELPTIIKNCIKNVGGGTAMWDAINKAIQSKKEFLEKEATKNKKSSPLKKERLIILTDGEDTTSKSNFDEVIHKVAFINMHQTEKIDFVLTVIAVGEAQHCKKLNRLCQPDFCHLIPVDDYWNIAKAMQSAC